MRHAPLRRVDPISELGGDLLGVEKPSRYLGGEALSIRKEGEGLFNIALCFPDLYEIGMSNNAIRILYSGLNSRSSLRAERVFAPAPDFEALLAKRELPLYTLETGIALPDVDMLGLAIGYELAATSIVTVLNSGRIPIKAEERGEGDPIVIAGGPASTNPHPYAIFLDAAYIGEAEAGFYDLCEALAELKSSGASRSELLGRMATESEIWMPERPTRAGKRATRAIYGGFSEEAAVTGVPLPSVKTVQDHGTVEIMRGCPNGCRFCHAGFYYRPQRIKSYEVIRAEVEALVRGGGYREITLASLSSGDYPGIGELLDALNAEWGPERVSFQLPSLKISSFTLPIVRKLAEVRKSGLTFAVETPVDEWQRMINKDVSFEKTVSILEEAKAAGFKQAKFYFMIGLPVTEAGPEGQSPALAEVKAIVDFFERLGKRIQLQINVNVGTFVPKPHTPFQWARQLTEAESLEAVNYLRSELKRFRNIKLSYHSPFISQLEGVIARGDERVGELILEAWKRGARLDAWEEHFDRELWRSVLEGANWPVIAECCAERSPEVALVWDDVGLRVSKAYYRRELEACKEQKITSACAENCTTPCGSCTPETHIVHKNAQAEARGQAAPPTLAREADPPQPRRANGRLVFRYSKTGSAAYLQHLSIIDAFERAFLMANLDIAYSEGFNPMPRLETAQPIPIAVESRCEMASLLVCSEIEPKAFVETVNARLPRGLRIEEAASFPLHEGKKQRTIGSLEWGSLYAIQVPEGDSPEALEASLRAQLEARQVPGYLLTRSSSTLRLRLRLPANKDHGLMRLLEAASERRPLQTAYRLCREELYATPSANAEPVSFFEAYRIIESQE